MVERSQWLADEAEQPGFRNLEFALYICWSDVRKSWPYSTYQLQAYSTKQQTFLKGARVRMSEERNNVGEWSSCTSSPRRG